MSESNSTVQIQAFAQQDWAKIRTAKHVSLDEIVEQTNIPLVKLEALERQEFEALGRETFACGYLRRYAKIIEEDPENYIAVYKSTLSTEPEESKFSTQSFNAVVGGPKRLFDRLGILHLSLGAIAIWVVLMLVFKDRAPQEVEFDADELAAVIEEATGEQALEDIAPAAGVAVADTSLLVESADTNDADAIDNSVLDLAAEVLDESDATVTNAAVELGNSDEDVSVSQDTPTEDLLLFSFSDDCWVNVKDATGRVLIAELKRKGDNLQLFGKAPFEVMMGDARAVVLTLNGNVIATTPPSGKKTLRITVTP